MNEWIPPIDFHWPCVCFGEESVLHRLNFMEEAIERPKKHTHTHEKNEKSSCSSAYQTTGGMGLGDWDAYSECFQCVVYVYIEKESRRSCIRRVHSFGITRALFVHKRNAHSFAFHFSFLFIRDSPLRTFTLTQTHTHESVCTIGTWHSAE